MPCWSIHLAIARRINKELNYNKNIFYFANIIPDIDCDITFNRYDAHFYGTLKCEGCPNEELPDIDRFLKKYRKDLKDPLICGYYCHLLSDYYYNKEIYTKYYVQDENNNIIGIKQLNGKTIFIENDLNGNIKENYKHKDFESYGKELYKNKRVEFPVYDKDILNSISKLKINCLNEIQIKKTIEMITIRLTSWNTYSLHEKIFGIKYFMIRKKDLDILYENCIKYIIEELKKNQIITYN